MSEKALHQIRKQSAKTAAEVTAAIAPVVMEALRNELITRRRFETFIEMGFLDRLRWALFGRDGPRCAQKPLFGPEEAKANENAPPPEAGGPVRIETPPVDPKTGRPLLGGLVLGKGPKKTIKVGLGGPEVEPE